MTVNKVVDWTLRDGRKITAEIISIREVVNNKTISADGVDVAVAVDELVKSDNIVCKIDGQKVAEGWLQMAPKNNAGVVAVIGKVGLTAETYELVKSAQDEAIAEAEAETEVAACITRLAEKEKARIAAEEKYDAHVAKMNKAMSY